MSLRLGRSGGVLVGLALLTGCLNEESSVTLPAGDTTTSGADASSTGEPSTTGEVPTTTTPSLMTTDGPTTTTASTSADATGPTETGSSTGPAAVCGDGIVDDGETCDDGDPDDADECPSSCVPAFCGDGFVHQRVEACDDGNKRNDDGCTNACTLPACGDGVTQDLEACDDGNLADDDWCTGLCQFASCGDGLVHVGYETCDDANAVDDDECHNDCTAPYCGDGAVIEGIEACDDGNLDDTDACTTLCQPATCGDGFVQAGVEGCDDGNDADDDGCVACEPATCGDGLVYVGVEQCDDADDQNTDECSNKCAITPTGVALTPGGMTPQFGDVAAGMAFVDACQPDQALTGFVGSLLNSQGHGRLGGRCSTLALDTQNDTFVIEANGKDNLPLRGMSGFNNWNRDCPGDQVLVGFSGRAGTGVDQLTFTCAPLIVVEAMDGSFSVALGPPQNLMPVGNNNNGMPFVQTDCPMGQVGTIQRIRAGTAIDAFGLGCSAVGLTYD